MEVGLSVDGIVESESEGKSPPRRCGCEEGNDSNIHTPTVHKR